MSNTGNIYSSSRQFWPAIASNFEGNVHGYRARLYLASDLPEFNLKAMHAWCAPLILSWHELFLSWLQAISVTVQVQRASYWIIGSIYYNKVTSGLLDLMTLNTYVSHVAFCTGTIFTKFELCQPIRSWLITFFNVTSRCTWPLILWPWTFLMYGLSRD